MKQPFHDEEFCSGRHSTMKEIHHCPRIPKFNKMDPDQQEALNVIPNSVYRTALKLRAVQSLCQLDLTNVSLIDDILPSHSCQAENQKPLPAEQLLKGLTELFKKASSEKPGQVEPKAPELTLRLLAAAYDRNGVGFIQPRSAAAAMIALSGDSLPTKYRALFQLYATCSGRGSGSSLHISRTSVRTLLIDLLQLIEVVGEGHNMSHVESATHSCFSGVLNSAVGEERFLAWLWSEPTILLWLPALYRLLATEMVIHKVKCNVCKHFPITGLRYHCMKCLNFDLCQTCFFTGQHCKPHKKTHPIVEHCRPVSARENIKLFFRTIRNNLLPGRCKRKEALRRKSLGLMDNRDFSTQCQPHPSSLQLISTGDPEPPDLLPAEHTSKLQLSHPSDSKASQAHQEANNGRSLDQKITSSQVPSSLELELAKAQKSIRALQNESRHLRKQLTKWKNQVQAFHSAQEDRNRRFDELIVNQENLKMELQKMRIEIKTLCNNKSLKERNLQHGTSHPPFKPKHMKYLKCKSAPCIEKKGFLKEPQRAPLSKNPRMPATTLQSQPSPNASPEVVHHENQNRETVPPTNHSRGQKPEHNGDHLSMGIKTSSSPSSPPREACLSERQTEEEELQHLLAKLKDALSFQAQPGQSGLPKDGLISTAEHVYKSFSDVISQVTLPARKYDSSGTSPFLLLDCPRSHQNL